MISTRERRTRPVWRVVAFRGIASLPGARITRLAWTAWGIALTMTAVSLLLFTLNMSHPGVYVFDYWAETTVIALANSTVGALIASRRPKNPIGWIFCVVGLFAGARHLSAQYAIYSLLSESGSLPGGEVSAWISSWVWVLYVGPYAFLGLLFPDGRLPSRR